MGGAENGVGGGAKTDLSGAERAKSAAQNPLHHKISQCKKLNIDFKSYSETDSVNYYFVCSVEHKSDYLANEHHFNDAALCSGNVKRRNLE